MERYVKTALNNQNSANQDENQSNKTELETPRTDSSKSPLKRKDSLIRSGTGRYAEELGDNIATEKGLLKSEFFQHV